MVWMEDHGEGRVQPKTIGQAGPTAGGTIASQCHPVVLSDIAWKARYNCEAEKLTPEPIEEPVAAPRQDTVGEAPVTMQHAHRVVL